jgi:excisionase family DNA binding protein
MNPQRKNFDGPVLPTYDATAQDIAARYGVTDRHITNLARNGDIPGIRIGSVWRFDPTEVHEALVQRSRTIRQPRKGERDDD